MEKSRERKAGEYNGLVRMAITGASDDNTSLKHAKDKEMVHLDRRQRKKK